jgi:threonine dehydrogenase-like Zn-dependent dehydrogenase
VSIVGVSLNMALPFPMALVLLKKLTVRATVAAIPATWPRLLDLLQSGRLAPDAVFTHYLGLGEAPAAYRMFDAHDPGVLKIMLDPSR